MSSYWGACTGLALMLTEEEVNEFYKSYLSKTYYPNDAEDHIEELENLLGEYSYLEKRRTYLTERRKVEQETLA